MSDVCLIVNTISKNADVWKIFFDSIEKYFDASFLSNKYVFVDDDLGQIPDDYSVINYSTDVKYRDQFVTCIEQVKEKYCIYISEDYILYDHVDTKKISSFFQVLDNNPVSFVRFMRGGTYDGPFENFSENLFHVPTDQDYFYTNQAALWKTEDLKLIHKRGPNLHIANTDWQNSFEYQATKTCKELGITGLFCYYGESKRGEYHYDSSVFPHISTALVKGKWNMSEYPREMSDLINHYRLDITKRGWI